MVFSISYEHKHGGRANLRGERREIGATTRRKVLIKKKTRRVRYEHTTLPEILIITDLVLR
jgi:hypothetical protein